MSEARARVLRVIEKQRNKLYHAESTLAIVQCSKVLNRLSSGKLVTDCTRYFYTCVVLLAHVEEKDSVSAHQRSG